MSPKKLLLRRKLEQKGLAEFHDRNLRQIFARQEINSGVLTECHRRIEQEEESGIPCKINKNNSDIDSSFSQNETSYSLASPAHNNPIDNSSTVELQPPLPETFMNEELPYEQVVTIESNSEPETTTGEIIVENRTETDAFIVINDQSLEVCEYVGRELLNSQQSDDSMPITSKTSHGKPTYFNRNHNRASSRPWRAVSPESEGSDTDVSQIFSTWREGCEDHSHTNQNITSTTGEDVGSNSEEEGQYLVGELPEYALEPAQLPGEMPAALRARVLRADAAADAAARALLSPPHATFCCHTDDADFTGKKETFTGVPGPTFPIHEIKNPLDIFLKIWDEEIMAKIVERTNRYARKHCRESRMQTDSPLPATWHPTDVAELYLFIAQLLHQSVVPLPTNGYCHPSLRAAALPQFEQPLSPDRFNLLERMFYYADDAARSDDVETYDQRKRREIQLLVDCLNKKFQSLFLPDQCLSLDESTVGIAGRLKFSQKLNAEDRGISYELCDAKSGYIWSFKINPGGSDSFAVDKFGKESSVSDLYFWIEQLRTATGDIIDSPDNKTKIAIELVSPLLDKGYSLIMDSSYNTPLFTRYLKLRKTDSFGILRLTRDEVPQIMKLKPLTGDNAFATFGDIKIIVIVYKKSFISMISTYHQDNCESLQKPQMLLDYIKCKKRIDKKNEILARFPMVTNSTAEWYMRVFKWLLTISINNAYIIYKYKDPNMTRRKFRIEIAEAITEKFKRRRVEYVRTIREYSEGWRPRPILENNHFPCRLPRAAQCAHCARQARRRQTLRQCDVCLVPLCLTCMKPYHEDNPERPEASVKPYREDNPERPEASEVILGV